MVIVVLSTFLAARAADFGAESTEFDRELGTATHVCGRHPAGLSTVAIEADALDHVFDVRLAETGVGAMLTGLGAFDAGGDAGSVSFVSHGSCSFR